MNQIIDCVTEAALRYWQALAIDITIEHSSDDQMQLNRFNMQGVDQSYRVKPHEQLVLVSLTHYCASTPNLSTSWS